MANEFGTTLRPRFIVDSAGVTTVARLGAALKVNEQGLFINGLDVGCWVADAPITVEHVWHDLKAVTLTLLVETATVSPYKNHEPSQATIYPASTG